MTCEPWSGMTTIKIGQRLFHFHDFQVCLDGLLDIPLQRGQIRSLSIASGEFRHRSDQPAALWVPLNHNRKSLRASFLKEHLAFLQSCVTPAPSPG